MDKAEQCRPGGAEGGPRQDRRQPIDAEIEPGEAEQHHHQDERQGGAGGKAGASSLATSTARKVDSAVTSAICQAGGSTVGRIGASTPAGAITRIPAAKAAAPAIAASS